MPNCCRGGIASPVALVLRKIPKWIYFFYIGDYEKIISSVIIIGTMRLLFLSEINQSIL
jgi:hypothetical protein